jgi:hypothetical protein
MGKVREMVLPQMHRNEPIEASMTPLFQTRSTLRRRDAPTLRSARQAGQLPSGNIAVAGQRPSKRQSELRALTLALLIAAQNERPVLWIDASSAIILTMS